MIRNNDRSWHGSYESAWLVTMIDLNIAPIRMQDSLHFWTHLRILPLPEAAAAMYSDNIMRGGKARKKHGR